MILSAVTVSLVPEVRGGPFVFWDDLANACQQAVSLGFDGIEIFPPSAQAVDAAQLRTLLKDNDLALAAVGTGAGWVRQRLSLTADDPAVRTQARRFIRTIIDLAGSLGAPAIIGSMQGRHGGGRSAQQAREYLREALSDLGEHARSYGVPLLYEPLNRYETNLCNTLGQAVELIRECPNVQLLADLFHMNIEEDHSPNALREAAARIGHVHFVDSNRKAAGFGQLDFRPIAHALAAIDYAGYLSAEAFAWPDSHRAAQRTIETFRSFFR
ncbi:MAG: sugar phosphate isomerase/epimerase family protein [Gemmataceae bacterium]